MPEFSIRAVADAVDGQIFNLSGNIRRSTLSYKHYQFDSRAVSEPNTLFFALKSAQRDGHEFVAQLEGKPGIGAVVSHRFDHNTVSFPVVKVEDPLTAAQRLAAHTRNIYRGVKYVGITGSAGKTTTKEFVFQLLSHKFKKAFRSFKNWNNWIGLPFSLLNMDADVDAAVFELAMSDPGIGEIDMLAGILRPDAAVIVNAFPVHLEYLKTVENVARAKSEILAHLDADDIAFVNGDQQHLADAVRDKPGRKIFFGRGAGRNHIRLKEIIRENEVTHMVMDWFGLEAQLVTSFINQVHVENLFTAVLVAQHLGMKLSEIQEALQDIRPLDGRGDIRRHGSFTIVDETYNSNPEALKKTLAWVGEEYRDKGEVIAVVGDMLELGDDEVTFHREVGEYFARLPFNRLITVGARARDIALGAEDAGFDKKNIHSFDDAAAAGEFLKKNTAPGSALLFKASRGIRLEDALKEFISDEK